LASGTGGSSGSAVLPAVVALALLMLTFLGAANLVLDEYAKGALRTAVDQGAQAGAAAGGSLAACERAVGQARGDLLPGPFGHDVVLACSLYGDAVVASASGYLPSFVPDVAPARVSVQGVSVIDTGAGG
jgi:hypothetical protein